MMMKNEDDERRLELLEIEFEMSFAVCPCLGGGCGAERNADANQGAVSV